MNKQHLYRFLITLWAALLLSFHAKAQAHKNSLSIAWGPSYLARQDIIFSPLVHEDWSLVGVNLKYNRSAKTEQYAQVSFTSFNPIIKPVYAYYYRSNPDDKIQVSPHSFTFVRIDYGFGKKLNNALTLGGAFQNDINAMYYVYGRSSTFGYFASFGIGPWVKLDKQIKEKSSIRLQAQLPLIAWTGRSPYLANDDQFIENTYSHSGFNTFFAYVEDGKLLSLNRFQKLDLFASYDVKLTSRWAVGAGYNFRFLHVSQPRPLWSYQHDIQLKGAFLF